MKLRQSSRKMQGNGDEKDKEKGNGVHNPSK